MKKDNFHSLLQSLVRYWHNSSKAYAEYMEKGKKFRHALILKEHNTSAKNLLVDSIAVIPDAFKKDVEQVIGHYTVWSAKWDKLKAELNPAPNDEFTFENDHRFPKMAAQPLGAALQDLS